MADDEVWDDSPIERAIDCLAEIGVAAEELLGIADLNDDGLRVSGRAVQPFNRDARGQDRYGFSHTHRRSR